LRKYFSNKLITGLVVFFFISGGNVYPQQASAVQETVSNVGAVNPPSAGMQHVGSSAPLIQPDLNPYNITIPQEFGNIEEVFQGAPTSPLVVHIQNVHANYEAQVNIKAILNHLVEKYKFSLVQLEGAVSKLDPTILQPSYLKEANLKLVDFLLREGRITGADAFAVETDKPVELYGIEDLGLYMENLKTFKSVYKHQEEVKTYFDEIHRLIQNVGPKLFNPEALDFTRKTEEFAGDKIDILDYLMYMNKLSEKHQLTSMNDMKEITHYPNLVRLMRLHKLEDQLNKSGLKKEMEALKLEFRKKMPDSEKVEKLLARLDDSAKGIAPRSYFLELTKAADEAKIDFIGYPAFRIFAEFLIHQDEIDHQGLFSELKQFESYLQEKLFTAEDEKTLLEIISFVGLLEQYFRLEMSREKLALYLKDREKIKPSWIAEHLEELAKKYEVNAKSAGDLQKLDSYMDELEYFYRLVLKRDEIFTEKILTKMKSLQQDKTVIITGGFHRDGLRDHFRKENISYIVINPKVDVKQGNENYLKVMLDEDAVVGSVFAGTFAAEIKNITAPAILRSDVDLMKLLGVRYVATISAARGLPQTSETSNAQFIEQSNLVPTSRSGSSGIRFLVSSTELKPQVSTVTVNIAFYPSEGTPRGNVDTSTYYKGTDKFEVRVGEPLTRSEMRKQFGEPPRPTIPEEASAIPSPLPSLKNVIVTSRPSTVSESLGPKELIETFGPIIVPPNKLLTPDAERVAWGLLSIQPVAAAKAVKRMKEKIENGESPSTEAILKEIQTAQALTSGNLTVTPDHIELARQKLGYSRERAEQLTNVLDYMRNAASSEASEPRIIVVPIFKDTDEEMLKGQLEFLADVLKARKNTAGQETTFAVIYAAQSVKEKASQFLESLGVDVKGGNARFAIHVMESDRSIRAAMREDIVTNSGTHYFNDFRKLAKNLGFVEVQSNEEFLNGGYLRVMVDNDLEGQELSASITNRSLGIIQLSLPEQKQIKNRLEEEAVAAFGPVAMRAIPTRKEMREGILAEKIREEVIQMLKSNEDKNRWEFKEESLIVLAELYRLQQEAFAIASAA